MLKQRTRKTIRKATRKKLIPTPPGITVYLVTKYNWDGWTSGSPDTLGAYVTKEAADAHFAELTIGNTFSAQTGRWSRFDPKTTHYGIRELFCREAFDPAAAL